MSSLSVAVIAHNEEEMLPGALASVAWADQVVLIDCSSTDATGRLAREAGAEVFVEPNRSNLNLNKNLAIDRCTGDWVLVLDADERIPPALAEEIRRVMDRGRHAGYFIPRRNHVLGKWVRHGGQYPDLQLRLFRRGTARFPARHVHERISVKGSVGRLHHPMDHHPYPTVTHMLRKGEFYASFEAEKLLRRGASYPEAVLFLNIGLRQAGRFLRRFLLKGGFLDGVPGLAVAWFDAFNHVVRWLRVWEVQQRRGEAGSE